jgi:hypothetical protein
VVGHVQVGTSSNGTFSGPAGNGVSATGQGGNLHKSGSSVDNSVSTQNPEQAVQGTVGVSGNAQAIISAGDGHGSGNGGDAQKAGQAINNQVQI